MNRLIINPIGGLANRMRFIASSLTLAKELRSEYSIVWLRNWEIGASFEQIFEMPSDLEQLIEYPSSLRYSLLYSIPRKKNFYLTALTRSRFALAVDDASSPMLDILHGDSADDRLRELLATVTSSRDILIQGGTNIYHYSPEFYRRLFRLKANLQERVDNIVAELGDNAVGVHIRRTDNQMSIENSPESVFEKAMLRELENAPLTKFYLATDSEEVKARFKAQFGEHVLVSQSVARRDTLEGIEDAAVEMFVLANTTKIYGSFYSSFSEASAMLGDIPLVILKS